MRSSHQFPVLVDRGGCGDLCPGLSLARVGVSATTALPGPAAVLGIMWGWGVLWSTRLKPLLKEHCAVAVECEDAVAAAEETFISIH